MYKQCLVSTHAYDLMMNLQMRMWQQASSSAGTSHSVQLLHFIIVGEHVESMLKYGFIKNMHRVSIPEY